MAWLRSAGSPAAAITRETPAESPLLLFRMQRHRFALEDCQGLSCSSRVAVQKFFIATVGDDDPLPPYARCYGSFSEVSCCARSLAQSDEGFMLYNSSAK